MTIKYPPVWVMNEKWEYWTDDITGKRYARVTGRERCPEELKKNWLWGFQNSYEERADDAPWYHPEWPIEKRRVMWNYFRNPLQNARLFIWGWADRNYTVQVLDGNPDPMVVQRNDVIGADGLPEQGYQRTLLTLDDGSGETRKFTSYCGPKLVWYSGTQPQGIFGVKYNPLTGFAGWW